MDFQGPAELKQPAAVDFYSTLHKGLRRALCRVSVNLGACDAADAESVTRVLDELRAVLKLTGKLGAAEMTHVHEFLDRVRPDATQAARADSARQARAAGALLRLEAEARRNRGGLRAETVATLNASFSAFVGEALIHMADAEIELMPLLCESASSEEIDALQRRLLADLGSETIYDLTREIVQAVAEFERIRFLRTLQRFDAAVALPAVWWSARGLWTEVDQALDRAIGDECARIVLA